MKHWILCSDQEIKYQPLFKKPPKRFGRSILMPVFKYKCDHVQESGHTLHLKNVRIDRYILNVVLEKGLNEI